MLIEIEYLNVSINVPLFYICIFIYIIYYVIHIVIKLINLKIKLEIIIMIMCPYSNDNVHIKCYKRSMRFFYKYCYFKKLIYI